MEAVLLWPSVAVLGFLAMAALVIGLGRGSTARYEYERNSVSQQRQSAAVGAVAVSSAGAAPAAASVGEGARRGGAAAPASHGGSPSAIGVDTARRTTGQRPSAPGWWLVDECAEPPGARIVAGPFADLIDAEWAALANGLADTTRAVYGQQRADGALVSRQTPHERAWLAELDAHLDRLPEDWDALLSDTDALATLVVEVGAALVEAGLPLHDCSGRGRDGADAAGGVCLTPDVASFGVLVSWHAHDRLSVQQVRGAAADAAVARTMGAAVADVLVQLGFAVESVGTGYRVTPRPQD